MDGPTIATETIKVTDWIMAVSAGISALSIVFVAVQTLFAKNQLVLLRQQLIEDHDRSRRQTAVDLMATWTERLDRSTTAARKLVQGLSREDTVKIANREPMKLPEGKRADLLACLHEVPEADGGTISLDVQAVSTIRWQLMTYLNTLECVLTAWDHNIADREIMASQFGYLVEPAKGHDACKDFRDATGGVSAFPAIYKFTLHLEEAKTRSVSPPSKGPLGVPRSH